MAHLLFLAERIAGQQEQIDSLMSEKEQYLEIAPTLGPKPEKVRIIGTVQQEIKKLEKSFKKIKERLEQVQVDSIRPNYDKYAEKFYTLDAKLQEQKKGRSDLRKSVNERWEWLENEKQTQAKRCQNIFQDY